MKQLFVMILPLALSFLTACGGGSGNPSPPPLPPILNSPLNQAAVSQLNNQLLPAAQQACTSTYVPYVASLAQSGFNSAAVPPPAAGGCQNSLIQALLFASTIANGQWIQQPAAQQYLTASVQSMVNGMGSILQGQGITLTPAQLQQLAVTVGPQIQAITNQVASQNPTLGTAVQSQIGASLPI